MFTLDGVPLLYNGKSGLRAAERHKRAMASLEIVGLGERCHDH